MAVTPNLGITYVVAPAWPPFGGSGAPPVESPCVTIHRLSEADFLRNAGSAVLGIYRTPGDIEAAYVAARTGGDPPTGFIGEWDMALGHDGLPDLDRFQADYAAGWEQIKVGLYREAASLAALAGATEVP